MPLAEPIHVLHMGEPCNITTPQCFEPMVILYAINQPINPQLWNSNFCPFSIFSMNEYLKGNVFHITCSLLRIVVFIRQHKLKDKTVEDISQISEFSFVAWEFF